MQKIYTFFFLFFISFLFLCCKKPDITPAYLLLTQEDFTNCVDVSNFNKEHSENVPLEAAELEAIKHQIFKDVFVSLNGKELGYWSLPCKIPLLPDYAGNNILRIIPCTRIPNTSLTTVQYSFLKPVEKHLYFTKEDIVSNLNFKYEYETNVRFPKLEIFETSTSFVSRDTTQAKIVLADYDNKKVGKITLEDSLYFFNIVTDYFPLLGRGVKQYWEIYYKSENGEMTTYLNFQNTVSGVTHQDMIVLPATGENWKKIYIDLTDIVSMACGMANTVSVRLGIRGLKNNENKNANFYFDYVKLITMPAPY